jgi:hypothetical protein
VGKYRVALYTGRFGDAYFLQQLHHFAAAPHHFPVQACKIPGQQLKIPPLQLNGALCF